MEPRDGIIDMLEIDSTENSPGFTVNVSASPPVVQWTLGVGGRLFRQADCTAVPRNAYFQRRDHVLLLSAWVIYPYCFRPAIERNEFELVWSNSAGPFDIPELNGSSGAVSVPVVDQEVPLNVFLSFPTEVQNPTLNCALGLVEVRDGDVSMVNVPSVLDTMELPIRVCLKILHTLPMVDSE